MADEEDLPLEENDDELFEHYKIVADKGQGLVRVDKFLQTRLEKTSRSRIQSAADNGFVRVNGESVKSSYKVKPLDVVTMELPYPVREIELRPENIPLDIVYEDPEVVVINKPAGLVVHPGHGNYTGTLVNALIFHFENLPDNTGNERPGLIHRIDKNTTGLMVCAKTEQSMTHLAKQFFDRTIERRYVALVWGDVKEDGTIIGNLGRSVHDRKLMTVYPEGEGGKHAVTHYKLLESFGYVSLVECKLETGRTHQIRAHMKYIGHPLFNDPEYGGDRILKGTTFSKYKQFIENCFAIVNRQALHAKSLGFEHPATGKWHQFEIDLPEDMKTVIEKWRTYTKASEGKH
jgi:23S rRNA pseudouridine1911/1915/1917 synthase